MQFFGSAVYVPIDPTLYFIFCVLLELKSSSRSRSKVELKWCLLIRIRSALKVNYLKGSTYKFLGPAVLTSSEKNLAEFLGSVSPGIPGFAHMFPFQFSG